MLLGLSNIWRVKYLNSGLLTELQVLLVWVRILLPNEMIFSGFCVEHKLKGPQVALHTQESSMVIN